MSRRARVLLLTPVLAAGILVAGAGPASAAAMSPNANCVAQQTSSLNQLGRYFGIPGLGGRILSYEARDGFVGQMASSDTCY